MQELPSVNWQIEWGERVTRSPYSIVEAAAQNRRCVNSDADFRRMSFMLHR